MRRIILMLIVLFAAWTVVPVMHAFAQIGGGGGGGDQDDQAEKKKKRDSEWELRQAPLPGKRNAGPCPYVKVLYDAARFEEFKNGQEASGDVEYTGEIEGVDADCDYRGSDPIKLKMQVNFALGRGPAASSAHKTYRYWVAVTQRNRAVIAKQYFDLPVNFGDGDRIRIGDRVNGIVIPRANNTVSGENFEVLVGFDVTPEMADFNRQGKRFRINAGAPEPTAGTSSSGS